MISVKNVSKAFGSLKAVDQVSFEVNQGELFSFLGPNGAGKTTTIKLMVGLMRSDSGFVIIDGQDIQQDPVSVKGKIGYVPDAAFLYDKLTGIEFFEVMGHIFHMSSSEIHSQLKYYRERLEMGDWLQDRIESYSRGMKQRVVFATAFFHHPKVMIIDEPMVGLDPRTARIIKELLVETAKSGVAIFFSTHDLNVAEELSHKIAIINKGCILGMGTINDLRIKTKSNGNLEDIFLKIIDQDERETE